MSQERCRFCGLSIRHLYGQLVSVDGSRCPSNPADWPKNLHSVWVRSLDEESGE